MCEFKTCFALFAPFHRGLLALTPLVWLRCRFFTWVWVLKPDGVLWFTFRWLVARWIDAVHILILAIEVISLLVLTSSIAFILWLVSVLRFYFRGSSINLLGGRILLRRSLGFGLLTSTDVSFQGLHEIRNVITARSLKVLNERPKECLTYRLRLFVYPIKRIIIWKTKSRIIHI